MRSFRYEAMDSAGERQKGDLAAANAADAMQVLRARGLFVVTLCEATDDADLLGSSAAAPQTVACNANGCTGKRTGMVATAAGLLCLTFGLYGVIDAVFFGMRAERIDATVVDVDHTGEVSSDVLEFTARGRQYRVDGRGSFGVVWGPSQGLRRRVAVLYPTERPEDARLAAFVPRFAVPLILLVVGGLFAPAGLLLLRNGNVPRFLKVIYIGLFVAAGVTGALFAILPILRR